MSKKLFYKIGEACKLLDIQPYVLRYWETEFPFLSPGKSKSGQRVYSAKELEIIRRIKVLLYEEGYTIAGAKKRLETDLPGILQSESIDDLEIDDEAFAASGSGGDGKATPKAAPPAGVKPPATQAPAVPAEPAPVAADEAPARAALPATEHPPAAASQTAEALDTSAALQIKTLRAGIQHALGEARALLDLLEKASGASQRSSAARR